MANVNKPLKEFQEREELLQKFIPGLHIPGQNFPQLPETRSNATERQEIPDELVRGYKSGAKHPVSAVMEFCSKLKLDVQFKEVGLDDYSVQGCFACVCSVDKKPFPKGIGGTKKEAKTKAAANAFDKIMAEGFELRQEEPSSSSTDIQVTSEAEDDPTQPKFGSSNPVSMVYEYCARNALSPSVTVSDKQTARGFQCDISVNGEKIATSFSNSKQDAKTRAGDEAIKILLHRESLSQTRDKSSHFDRMAASAMMKLQDLQRNVNVDISTYKVLAAFIVMYDPQHPGEVVALATGDGCVRGDRLVGDGRTVIDCHAEVIARRSLVKWFCKQLSDAIASLKSDRPNNSVFTLNENGEKFKLKDTVSLHMYINTAPCGDASAFPMDTSLCVRVDEAELINCGRHPPTFTLAEHGQLRVKAATGSTTVPVLRIQTRAVFENSDEDFGVAHVQFQTMTCSDKILKWNVLGLQGSVLSHILEPVYMNSFTLGNNFDLGHLVRAICCRGSEELNNELPQQLGYHLRHPIVGRVSVYKPLPVARSNTNPNNGINWCAADQLVEIINAETGLTVPESPFHTCVTMPCSASRLCKCGAGHRFRALAKTFNPRLLNRQTYGELKAAAYEYNQSKKLMYDHLEKGTYGTWMRRGEVEDNITFAS